MLAIARSRPRGLLLVVALMGVVAWSYLATRPPASRVLTYYPNGHAAVAIDGGPPTTFDLVDRGALFDGPLVESLAWRTADGWYLSLTGSRRGTSGALAGAIDSRGTLQVSADHDRRWAGFDSGACAVVYSEMTVNRIAGSIRCQGLVWYDASSVENVKRLDLPPFEMDVTFEATGDGALPNPGPS
jgi:hypothetical protein